jgi:hypothetical protein
LGGEPVSGDAGRLLPFVTGDHRDDRGGVTGQCRTGDDTGHVVPRERRADNAAVAVQEKTVVQEALLPLGAPGLLQMAV